MEGGNKKKTTYQRSYQDTMTAKQIAQKLEGYVEVEDISKVSLNTHLRYFSLIQDKQTGKVNKKFRIGGFLKVKEQAEKYVILTNNTNSWSVNTKKSIFYRKLKIEEVKDYYEKKLKEYKKQIKSLKKELKGYKKKEKKRSGEK